MHSLTSSDLDLILARICAGCGHPGSMMCDQCERLLQPRPRLRRALDVGDLVSDLRVPVVCSLDYRGPVRQMLNAYKDDGQRSLTPWLAPALLASINHALITCVSTHQAPTLVPVPTRKSSQRRRGLTILNVSAQPLLDPVANATHDAYYVTHAAIRARSI